MTGRTRLREVKLTLPMAPDMEIVASQAASSLAHFIGMTPDRVDEVRLAVVECCINAFEHSRSEERKVDITFSLLGDDEPDTLEIAVHDEGIGFSPTDVEEPKIEAKLRGSRKRGWGLKIMQGLMDEVRILSGTHGTTVVMCKARGGRDGER
jgi:anti-sigma regulatory factor (Ser/Thr protein kinase)